MTIVVHLLGTPWIERDGVAQAPPRGNKAWGVLAYLLLTQAPVHRAELASLLFAEAQDPMAALRWSLGQLRKALGDSEAVRGDPVRMRGAEAIGSDVETVLTATWQDAAPFTSASRDLLGTMAFPGCPGFEVWLESERLHLQAAGESLQYEGALTHLAAGDCVTAARLASDLVRQRPYSEEFHVLLIRSLAASGDGIAAARAASACRTLFRRDLGVDPSPDVDAAASVVTQRATAPPPGGAPAVRAFLQAGEAAIVAGATDSGLLCLRQAVVAAESLPDRTLEARALVTLGSALVHAARGRDAEGATALHQAVHLARGHPSARNQLARATRELGYIEFLRARYDRVEPWLSQAEQADADDAERAGIAILRGATKSDTANYAEGLEALDVACQLTDGDRDLSYAMSFVGRLHLLRGDWDAAQEALRTSIDLAERAAWTAFLPWPQSQLGEVEMTLGDIAAAGERFEEAFALSCQLGDPCWQGAAARGLGLLAHRTGNVDEAISLLVDARVRCTSTPDGYLWLDTHTLDALCEVAIDGEHADAARWVAELAEISARRGMREHVVRAEIYKSKLGDDSGLAVAGVLSADIDNPILSDLLRQVA